MRRIILLFSFILCLALSGKAQIGGQHTFEFLSLSPSAKIGALGGSQVAVWGDDLNFAAQNPALLNSKMHGKFDLNFVNYFAGITFGDVAYAHNFKKYGTFSVNVKSFNYGDFLYADETGETFGTFGATETAYGVGWSYAIDSAFQFGVNVKGISSQLENYYSNGAAIDLGVVYHAQGDNFTGGLVFKNIGTQFNTYYTETGNEPLPFEIELAFSKKLSHAPFRIHLGLQHLEQFDLTYEDPANPSETENPLTGEIEKMSPLEEYGQMALRHLIIGAEFIPSKNFYVALGYNAQRRAEMKIDSQRGMVGFSWGFGLNVSKFRFGYGQAIYHLAGPSHQFSFGVNVAEFYSRG